MAEEEEEMKMIVLQGLAVTVIMRDAKRRRKRLWLIAIDEGV